MTPAPSDSVAIAFAGRAENLLMADFVIRTLSSDTKKILFADLPLNSSRRCNSILALIKSLQWHDVLITWYIKFSLLPALFRRFSNFGLEKPLRFVAVTYTALLLWFCFLVSKFRNVSIICGRPTIPLLLFCRLARPRSIVLLDSGPKQDVISHLNSCFRLLRWLPSVLGGFSGSPSLSEALQSLSDEPILLLCWSTARYQFNDLTLNHIVPINLLQFSNRFTAPLSLGNPAGEHHVFLIGKPDASRHEIRSLIQQCRAKYPFACPVYFRHPREDSRLASKLLIDYGVTLADPGLSIESHAMCQFRSINLLHVYAIRQSQSIQTLRMFYGSRFRVTFLR